MNLETPAGMSLSAMPTETLKNFVAEIFAKLGVPSEAARLAAAAFVAADVHGVSAHGLTLVPTYVERMLAGAVSSASEPAVVHDGGSAIVLDARNTLGPLSADWAIPMVSERAREHGLACIAVRNGAHFGTAAFWARQIAEAGLIGIVMSNRRPTKAPPGGSEPLTGNNALAIALPCTDAHPFVMDLDAKAAPLDPASAIAVLLAPNTGVRGFALSAAIDLLCGGLSGGSLGPNADTFGCSQLFMAMDPARFGVSDLPNRVAEFSGRIPSAKPGNEEECLLEPELVAKLKECAAKVGVQAELR